VAWEDPRIDGQVLEVTGDDVLLMLTTGGCNVLDRLVDGPSRIVTADLNPAQNALLELKLAAIAALEHEQFFELFALSNRPLFEQVYQSRLRPRLSASAASFWDGNAAFFNNVMHAGAAGFLAKCLIVITTLFGLRPLIRQFASCRTLAEQRKACDDRAFRIWLLRRFFTFLLPLICPFAGVPASQMTLASGGATIDAIFQRVFYQTHIAADNYFYYGYLFGAYTRENCPRYMRPEHFAKLKERVDRVSIHTGLLHEVASSYADGYFSAMVLLDHMDWLSKEEIVTEWAVFCRKLHPVHGRVLWRSFSQHQHIPHLSFLELHQEKVAAAEAVHGERVGTYNSTWLATLPQGSLTLAMRGVAGVTPPSTKPPSTKHKSPLSKDPAATAACGATPSASARHRGACGSQACSD